MNAATLPASDNAINVERSVDISAPPATVFESLLEQLGPKSDMPDGTPFPMVLEPWPGGRWFRDLGNNAGHLWGHVQVIKPPTLLEICGPLFMSYPAVSHVQYRLSPQSRGTTLKILHRAFGQIPDDHRSGVVMGWTHGLARIKQAAELRASR